MFKVKVCTENLLLTKFSNYYSMKCRFRKLLNIQYPHRYSLQIYRVLSCVYPIVSCVYPIVSCVYPIVSCFPFIRFCVFYRVFRLSCFAFIVQIVYQVLSCIVFCVYRVYSETLAFYLYYVKKLLSYSEFLFRFVNKSKINSTEKEKIKIYPFLFHQYKKY